MFSESPLVQNKLAYGHHASSKSGYIRETLPSPSLREALIPPKRLWWRFLLTFSTFSGNKKFSTGASCFLYEFQTSSPIQNKLQGFHFCNVCDMKLRRVMGLLLLVCFWQDIFQVFLFHHASSIMSTCRATAATHQSLSLSWGVGWLEVPM